MKRIKTVTKRRDTAWERVSQSHHTVWRIGQKVTAIGVVLERQSRDSEGFSELAGLGMVLSELGTDLGRVSAGLDDLGIHLAQAADGGCHD